MAGLHGQPDPSLILDSRISERLSVKYQSRPMHILTFATLYPHDGKPNNGIFVENRLRNLVSTGKVVSTVVAPVPWFPSASSRFGEWARNAKALRRESRNGLSVSHPRYLLLPRVSMSLAPAALFATAAIELRRLLAAGTKIELIDGHYLFPDGVVAVALGRAFNKPVVLTARGSDVTLLPKHILPRRMIRWALHNANALISVSGGLKSAMVELGAKESEITVLRNGVDLDLFRTCDANSVRANWGIRGKLLLSVGHLIRRKGHHIAIEALTRLPDWTLAIVGEGPEEARLRSLAVDLSVDRRVVFCGAHPHTTLPAFYAEADLLILASSREGWANVLLEAMACGTAVIASNIPGNSEVVSDVAAGEIVQENTALCFADAIQRVYNRKIPRSMTRAYAEKFSWEATSQGQIEIFDRVLTRWTSDGVRSPFRRS